MPLFWPDLKTVIGIFCATVTIVLWALCIWQLIIRFTPDAPPTESPCFCQNNGICPDQFCLCPEEWIGSHCETVNFCDASTYKVNSSQDILSFEIIIVGRYGYSREKCDNNTMNSGVPKATRMCTRKNGKPTLEPPSIMNCNVTLLSLSEKVHYVNVSSAAEIKNIATDTQILTAKPKQLNSKDISLAASIAGKILNLSSSGVPGETAAAAIATVSQLLDANETEFSSTNENLTNATISLTMVMQNFSVSSSSVEEVVQPNIAVQRVALQKTSATVLFSALKGSTNGLVSDRILIDEHATNLKTDDRTEIQMLINVANSTGRERVGFVLYQNDRLFPSKNYRNRLEENNSNQIISGNAHGTMINHVKIALSPQYNSSKFLLHNYACVFWDYSQNDWNTSGCTKEKDLSELLKCSCNHTTNFAVLMSFKINYKYLKPLKIVSYIGCGLSIGGLTSTIVFQIHTRKTRKMSTTIILVSLCSSMLIFNIIFISGIENSNANKSNSAISAPNTMLESDEEHPLANSWCTAVAALLHYFLLATFMWTTLNSVQLYLLTIKTQRHFHRNYSLIMLLTGWGTPALLVSITLAVTVENSNYRQEEFCWLEALEPDGTFSAEKPMLWAFLLPVAVILLFNFTVFMKITIFVIWKENKHLTSTKRKSYMMKIFGTLSIAVVLGITWILGYLMLIDHEQTNTAFSYLFCIFNATQGLQIFVFHVLATPTGKKKIGEVFASLSEMRLYLHSKTYYLLDMLHIKSPNESFRFSGSRRNVDNLSMSSSNEEMWQR